MDSSGAWHPKNVYDEDGKFKLPTPNSTAGSPTWSGMVTGTVHSASSATYAFDGLSTTQAQSDNTSELVFTPTDGLDFNTFELEYAWCA